MSDVRSTVQELDNEAFFALIRQEVIRRKLAFLGAGWEMNTEKTRVALLAFMPTTFSNAPLENQFTAVGVFVARALKEGQRVPEFPDHIADVELGAKGVTD